MTYYIIDKRQHGAGREGRDGEPNLVGGEASWEGEWKPPVPWIPSDQHLPQTSGVVLSLLISSSRGSKRDLLYTYSASGDVSLVTCHMLNLICA